MAKILLFLLYFLTTSITIASVDDDWFQALTKKYPAYAEAVKFFSIKGCALSLKKYEEAESLSNVSTLNLTKPEVVISNKRYWSQIENQFNEDSDILVFDVIAESIFFRVEITTVSNGVFWLKILDASLPQYYLGLNQLYRNCKASGYSIFTGEEGVTLELFSDNEYLQQGNGLDQRLISGHSFANDDMTSTSKVSPDKPSKIIAIVDTPVATSNSKIYPYIARNEDGKINRIHLFGDPNFIVEDNHGTNVAGIAQGNNSNIFILPVTKSFDNYLLAGPGSNFWPDQTSMFKLVQKEQNKLQLTSINTAIEMGASIVNMSFGVVYEDWIDFGFKFNIKHGPTGSLDGYRQAIKNNQNVVFVVAAGNDGNSLDNSPTVPAVDSVENDNQITVGSYTVESGKYSLSSFSNYSKKYVDILAPGEKIGVRGVKNKEEVSSGTSLAAPAVSNLIAKMFNINSSLTPQDVKKILCKTSRKIKSLRLASRCGLLDEAKALSRAKSFKH
jgi:hypothetical protein